MNILCFLHFLLFLLTRYGQYSSRLQWLHTWPHSEHQLLTRVTEQTNPSHCTWEPNTVSFSNKARAFVQLRAGHLIVTPKWVMAFPYSFHLLLALQILYLCHDVSAASILHLLQTTTTGVFHLLVATISTHDGWVLVNVMSLKFSWLLVSAIPFHCLLFMNVVFTNDSVNY